MLQAGDRAPAFALSDLDGQRHRLEARPGHGPALVVFWKADCATCHLAFPYLQRLFQAYPDGRWRLLAVSQDDAATSAAFAQEHALTFPILLDEGGFAVSKRYDPDATPTLFLVGPAGTVEMTSVGFHKGELNEISRRLAEHLGQPPLVIAPEDDGNPLMKPG